MRRRFSRRARSVASSRKNDAWQRSARDRRQDIAEPFGRAGRRIIGNKPLPLEPVDHRLRRIAELFAIRGNGGDIFGAPLAPRVSLSEEPERSERNKDRKRKIERAEFRARFRIGVSRIVVSLAVARLREERGVCRSSAPSYK